MAAPFDWMETPRCRVRPTATQTTRDDEILRRAGIYAHLGHPQALAEARLRARVAWEHERIGKATVLKRIPSLVAQAYGRAGRGAPAKKKA